MSLVEWFTLLDQTSRSDLRALNELNFARFDAKLEQRVTQLDAKLERRFGDMERRFGDMERRLSGQTRWLAGILMTTVLGFLGLGLTLAAPWLRH